MSYKRFLAATAVVVTAVALVVPGVIAAAGTGSTHGNLLRGDTASLAHVGTWAASNASLKVAHKGELSAITRKNGWVTLASGSGTRATRVTPGTTYIGTTQLRWGKSSHVAAMTLAFFDASGRQLVAVPGQPMQNATGAWKAPRQVVAIAPEGARTGALRVLVADFKAREVLQLRRPMLVGARAPRTAVVGPLHTSGKTLYDANGPLVLRGIHRVGLETSTQARGLTDADLLQVKRWGANTVRLAISQSYWPTNLCRGRAVYVERVDQVVNTLTRAGMVTMIDLHTNAPLGLCGDPTPQLMADDGSVAFWRSVANRYKSNPLVVFDLYNEPHNITADVWLNGGLVTNGRTAYHAVGMQKLYDVVRSTGSNNVVIISGFKWASALPPTLVAGKNIVYGIHVYTCPVSTDTSKCAPEPMDPTNHLSYMNPSGHKVPILFTEFGWPDRRDGRYVEAVIRYAQARGIGWIAFAWDGATTGLFSTTATLDAKQGYQPTPSGMPLLASLSRRP